MFKFIIGNTIFAKAILACCLLGVISWAILEISYFSMARATDKIGKTKKKWLVSLRRKYEDYHNMNVKVNNVNTFVERLFRKKKVMGLPIPFWRTLGKLSIAGCAIVGAAGALYATQNGEGIEQVFITYLTGVTAALCLFFMNTFLREEEKRHNIIVNMNDYLENVLDNSIEGLGTIEDAEERKRNRRRIMSYAKEHSPKRKRKVETITPEEERLLEDVLQEFFA